MENIFNKERERLLKSFPNFDEKPLKNYLFHNELKKVNKYKLGHSINFLNEKFIGKENLLKEITFLQIKIEELRESNVLEEVDIIYEQYKRGYLLADEFLYLRDFLPMGGRDFFTLKWSIKNANKTIKQNNMRKTNFSIDKMNIDRKEIDDNYLLKAIHNKNPGIVGMYYPLTTIENPEFYILLDGNHRIVAKSEIKSISKHPVFKLSYIQTFETLRHPFYAAYYLIHLLVNLFWNIEEQDEQEILNKFDTYHKFKKEFLNMVYIKTKQLY